jgi:hypothetical protein
MKDVVRDAFGENLRLPLRLRHYTNSLDLGVANDKHRYVTRNESA